MKRKICFVLVLVLICTSMASCGQQQEDTSEYDVGYDAGYTAGYDDGYDTGYEEGREAAYQEGYDDGHEDGYDGGHSDGYEEGMEDGRQGGYDDGYDEGYNDGANGVARYSEFEYSESEYNDVQSYNSVEPEPEPDPYQSQIVYVSRSGKIHSISYCSGMKYYTEMTYQNAVNAGYEFCSNCW